MGGVTVSLALTTAQITGGGGTVLLSGFENIEGSAFDDRLTGSAMDNLLVGGNGNDTLNGGLGNDELFGGTEASTFDQFVFNTALGATNVDQVNGFDVRRDTIVLENAIFTALGAATGALQASQFAQAGSESGTTRIIYETSGVDVGGFTSGNLYYDSDGIGSAARILFATVTDIPVIDALNADSFRII
jgi:Ca2+-binding RTX toxin-like protein